MIMDYLMLYKLGAMMILMLAQLGSFCVHPQDVQASILVLNATRMTNELAAQYYPSFQNVYHCSEKPYQKRKGESVNIYNMTISNATQFIQPFNFTYQKRKGGC